MAEVRMDYRRGSYGDDSEILSQRLTSSLGRASPRSPTEALQPEAIPPPPARSQAARHPLVVFFNFILTVAIVGVVALVGGVFAAKMQFDRPTALDQPRAITVDHGVSVGGIVVRAFEPGLSQRSIGDSVGLILEGIVLPREDGAHR